jgi:peptidoglycan/LPS O-acetylase OafA/YrhL
MRRIPSLDGLRAIAASLVVAAHLANQKKLTGIEVGGAIGVHLFFFVLSGYLITTLLLEEEHRTGAVSLRKFWLRRCWRILPAYFVYVVAIVILDHLNSVITLTPGSLAAALTFTTGWQQGNWELGTGTPLVAGD